MAGRLYEDLLGPPPSLTEQEMAPVGYEISPKKKAKIAILRKMLGDEGLAEVLKGARITENKGDMDDEFMGR